MGHQERILMTSLPRTFSDTISVVRKLGIRYLWINSLCIVQDSTADWELEASRMGDYYWNSILTIAAADSVDSSQGLFAERDSAALYPCATTFRCGNVRGKAGVPKRLFVMVPNTNYPHHWIWDQKTVLDGRGWTLQEKVLSRRTLTFDQFQISFACQHHRASEMRPSDKRSSYGERQLNSLLREPLLAPEDLYNLYEAWNRLVEEYWLRHLAFDSDMLPAVSGLASRVKLRLSELGKDDEYLAGMWKSNMMNSLC